MKEKDKITGAYREQVDRFIHDQALTGPSGKIGQEELDEVWEEICSELDLSETWVKISSQLNTIMPVDPGPGLFFKGCAAMLLVLLMLTPVRRAIQAESPAGQATTDRTYSTEDAGQPVPGGQGNFILKTEEQGKILPGDEASTKFLKQEAIVPVYKAVKQDITVSVMETDSPVTKEVVPVVSEAAGMNDEVPAPVSHAASAEPIRASPAAVPETALYPRIAFQADYEDLNHSFRDSGTALTSSPATAGRFTGGIVTSFKNTWLLNQETFDGLKPESLNTTELVVFPDAGLILNYSLSKKWDLQTDAFIYSSTGQEYKDYIFGHYSTKKIILRYSTIAISAKYRTGGARHPATRSSVNFLAGGYVSLLHRAEQKINTDIKEIRTEYTKFDYGIRLGAEYELQLNDQLSVAPGLTLSLGLPNIYKGTGTIPGFIRSTRNGNAGFHLSFYYHFY